LKGLQYLGLVIGSGIFFLAALGIYTTELNRDLTKVDKATGRVILSAVITHRAGGTRSFPQKVFMFQLNNINEALGTYRPEQVYTRLVENIKVGDTITVFYAKNRPHNNLNIDVYQIVKNGQILQDYKSYAHNNSIAAVFLIIAGFAILIFGILVIELKRYARQMDKKQSV